MIIVEVLCIGELPRLKLSLQIILWNCPIHYIPEVELPRFKLSHQISIETALFSTSHIYKTPNTKWNQYTKVIGEALHLVYDSI
jgi:hypothetical protein